MTSSHTNIKVLNVVYHFYIKYLQWKTLINNFSYQLNTKIKTLINDF